jgi:peptide/nickel transport system permease protein
MSFRRFFFVRLGWAVFGLWLAVTLVFLITRVLVSPADLCKAMQGADGLRCYRAVVEQQGLDQPVHERYLHFVWRLVAHQSPGYSFWNGGIDAGKVARHALPATASLVTGALILALALAVAAGIAWSRAGPKWEHVIRLPIYLAVGLSPVFLALWLSFYLGVRWRLVPTVGYCDFFSPSAGASCGGPRDWLSHLVLPVSTLSLFFAGIYARVVRAGVANIRAVPGKKERRELSRRFALVLARVVGRDFGWTIGAAALVEITFGIPGLGRVAILSVNNADLVLLEAVLLFAAFLAIAVHFVVDVIVGALDSDLRAEWPVAGMPRHA